MRPREFDHDEVLRIAFEQFWRKGVRGASLSDIARDAGVQRGSLYNAFGSKEALFLCAYQRYASEYLSALQKTLSSGTLRARLTAFFNLTIKNFRSGSPPRGCPTTRGLMELGSVEGEGLDENARQAFADLCAWGLVDAYRRLHTEPERYSWWDYRAGMFHKNYGMRIDHLLVTRPIAERVVWADIDREARKGKPIPSDHAPVIIDLDEPGTALDAGWEGAAARIAARRK